MTASWGDFVRQEPDFAAYVRGRLDEHGLALLATLTADGSPRISGIEPVITDEQLWLVMMPHSVKGADLHRDGRFALHNATIDKDVTTGDVKIHGVANPVPPGHRHAALDVGDQVDLFRADLTRVTAIRVAADRLAIDTWRPGQPLTHRTRT